MQPGNLFGHYCSVNVPIPLGQQTPGLSKPAPEIPERPELGDGYGKEKESQEHAQETQEYLNEKAEAPIAESADAAADVTAGTGLEAAGAAAGGEEVIEVVVIIIIL